MQNKEIKGVWGEVCCYCRRVGSQETWHVLGNYLCVHMWIYQIAWKVVSKALWVALWRSGKAGSTSLDVIGK